ncbi:LPS-assembly protein LptD [Terrarubrum flagellatum]|uniref:LPS-assembly protein LptD n=1 Tax=Terrirubrum flagellatum TaxID=2895980 RepID=UPI0031451DF9
MGRPARARTSGLNLWRVIVAGVAVCLPAIAFSDVAQAQGLKQLANQGAQQPGAPKSKMLVEANQLVYDNDTNKVSAVGNAQIYYDGKTLEADRVVYDRANKRVYAEGNVRMTDETGTVTHGDRFELTDNFKDGFIDSLRVESTTVVRGEQLKVRFAAPRAERTAGDTTIFQRGTYTTCEPCAQNPERPPLWQVKATKIIHNKEEQTIYYENASVELFGYPVAWIPYFWSPDNTVKRKTGFLAPRYYHTTALGTGVALPFFWNLAPNYDLTLTPTYLSRQGFLGSAEWRHRLLNGSYNIRASGIFQQEKGAFLTGVYGPGDKEFRGSIESAGTFYLSDHWRFGWDVTMQSDKWFNDHYRLQNPGLQQMYFRDVISTIYLRGQGDRSFFDMRGYYFQPTSASDWQKQQPVVAPVVDYNKRWNLAGPIGGEVGLDVNFVNLTRDQTQFAYIYRPGAVDANGNKINPLSFPTIYGSLPYEGCVKYNRSDCIIRGLAGQQTRASATLDWRRQMIDPLGQVWTPFASVRLDAVSFSAKYSNTPGEANTYARMYVNSVIPGAGNSSDPAYARVLPAVGMQYKFPLVATSSWGSHVLEPIAQIVARPNESHVGETPNNDAQSLVFDDTTLFETNKFSGYDRVEGGVRFNYGAQYTFQGNNGAYVNLLAGQSIQVAGRNSYTQPDLSNVGLNSGLDKKYSDWVARAIIAPGPNFNLTTRARFDEKSFSLKRLEVGPSFTLDRLSGSVLYARYEAQPELGYAFRREGVAINGNLKLDTNWSIYGGTVLDLDRYLAAREAIAQGYSATGANTRASLSSMSVGLQYKDECTIFSVQYVANGFRDVYNGTTSPSRALYVKLELRSLGEVNFSQSLSTSGSLNDGLSK